VESGEGSSGDDASSVSVDDDVASSSGRSRSFRNGWTDDGIEAQFKKKIGLKIKYRETVVKLLHGLRSCLRVGLASEFQCAVALGQGGRVQ
jgi:hypothetical protein